MKIIRAYQLLKELQRLVVVWFDLLPHLLMIILLHQCKGDANKSTMPYDTDDENRPLRLVRPHSNSRVQEQKGLNEIFANVKNKSESQYTDDENRPLSPLKDIEKKPIRKNFNEILTNENNLESHDTDGENRPLIPKVNLKEVEKQTVRSRANSRAKEFKNVIYTSDSHDTDSENRPLVPKTNSKDIEKQLVRPRENSRAQEVNNSDSYDADGEN